jgi:hypothetical protein
MWGEELSLFTNTPPYIWGTPPIYLHIGVPPLRIPLYLGVFFGVKGGLIPSIKFWKKIYGNETPLYKKRGKSKK